MYEVNAVMLSLGAETQHLVMKVQGSCFALNFKRLPGKCDISPTCSGPPGIKFQEGSTLTICKNENEVILHLIGGASDQIGTKEAGARKPARCRTSFAAGFSLFLPCERGGGMQMTDF